MKNKNWKDKNRKQQQLQQQNSWTNSEAKAEAEASHNMTWKTRRRDINTRAEKTRVLNAICAPFGFVNVVYICVCVCVRAMVYII